MTKSTRITLISLLSHFKNTPNVTPVDFIQQYFQGKKSQWDVSETDNFLSLMRHEQFLERIASKFNSLQKDIQKINSVHLIVLIYFAIFLLDQDNFEEILEAPTHYTKNLLIYLSSEDEYSFFTRTACSFFENDYVLNKILYPLLNKAEVLKELARYMEKCETKKFRKIPLTVPVEFDFQSYRRKSSPPPPSNTPHGSSHKIPLKKVPRTNWWPDLRIKKNVKKEHENNILKAQKLLEEAMKMPETLTNPKKLPDQLSPKTVQIKARKVPASLKKDVVIKGNLTTTLREASHLIKDQEDEINKIEDILRGGYNLQKIEEMELEDKKRANQRAMEDIQKKHIQGLITFEEAILAKKKLVEENRMKTLELKAAKLELAEKLDQWKEEEQEKIKAQVEKCQKIKTDAKESEKKALEKKQMEARLQQYETKQLLRKAEQDKAKELSRKIELIEEIKTLHEVTMRLNEAKLQFDPTECPNLGLLCEMSVAELNERLGLLKVQMKRELEEKKLRIAGRKLEQQQMIERVKKFVEETRKMPRMYGVQNAEPKFEETKELVELRRVLEEKRNLRMKAT